MVTTEEQAMRGRLELLLQYRKCGERQDGRKAFETLPRVVSRAGPGGGAADDNGLEIRSKAGQRRVRAGVAPDTQVNK